MHYFFVRTLLYSFIIAIYLCSGSDVKAQNLDEIILGGEIVFDEDIVVYADTIKIRAQTPITLKNDSTLYLIANNELNIGRFSTIYSTGTKGRKGEDGKRPKAPDRICTRGSNGSNGRAAYPGENAGSIVIIAKNITYDEPIYIRLNGGPGGDGGDGGKGGSGSRASAACTGGCGAGKGGNGGNGGNGGIGGNGGNISIHVISAEKQDVGKLFEAIAELVGGEPGNAGGAGLEGNGGSHHRTICGKMPKGTSGSNGKPGVIGTKGEDGRVEVKYHDKIEDAIALYDLENIKKYKP